MFRSVVIPLDGSEESLRALRPATAVAEYLGCELHIVSYHSPHSDGLERHRLISEQAEESGSLPVRVDVDPMTAPVPELLGEVLDSATDPLLVMSTRGHGRSAGLVGSVATSILARSHSPTMLIGPNCRVSDFRLDGPMIVATDDGEYTSCALTLAQEAAESFGYEPILVNVVDPDVSRALSRARAGVQGTDLPPDSAMVHRFADQLRAALGRSSSLDYRALHSKDPGEAVADEAAALHASLVVMATHARSGLKRFRLGSVTAATVTHAECPVLTVSPDLGRA